MYQAHEHLSHLYPQAHTLRLPHSPSLPLSFHLTHAQIHTSVLQQACVLVHCQRLYWISKWTQSIITSQGVYPSQLCELKTAWGTRGELPIEKCPSVAIITFQIGQTMTYHTTWSKNKSSRKWTLTGIAILMFITCRCLVICSVRVKTSVNSFTF